MIHGSMRHYPNGRKKSYNAWTTKTRAPSEGALVVSEPYRRETPVYKSHDNGTCNTKKKEINKYTGTFITGICTMHKSNAVPITNQQQAIEIARMSK